MNHDLNIESQWATRLLIEHKHICHEQKASLPTPAMNISGGERTLGSWSEEKNTISISRHLIESQIWDVVREILKHEMAHQYVSCFYHNEDIHGAYFKRACEKLGVHPVFRSAAGDLHKDLLAYKGELSDTAKKMLSKVEKLMALGRSTNEKEARAASRKANYLLNKYNLHQIKTEPETDIRSITICHKKKRIESLQRSIINLLINYYYVDGVTSYSYDALDDRKYRTIVLVGRLETLGVAEYVYHFLHETAQSLWQSYRKKNGAKRGEKVSFDMGFVQGITENHEAMLEKTPVVLSNTKILPVKLIKALKVQAKEQNRQEVKRLFPRLSNVTYGRCSPSSSAYKEGWKNGKKTHINRGVEKKQSHVSGLITSR